MSGMACSTCGRGTNSPHEQLWCDRKDCPWTTTVEEADHTHVFDQWIDDDEGNQTVLACACGKTYREHSMEIRK